MVVDKVNGSRQVHGCRQIGRRTRFESLKRELHSRFKTIRPTKTWRGIWRREKRENPGGV